MLSYWPKLLNNFFVFYCFLSLLSLYRLVLWGLGLWTWVVLGSCCGISEKLRRTVVAVRS